MGRSPPHHAALEFFRRRPPCPNVNLDPPTDVAHPDRDGGTVNLDSLDPLQVATRGDNPDPVEVASQRDSATSTHGGTVNLDSLDPLDNVESNDWGKCALDAQKFGFGKPSLRLYVGDVVL